MLNKNFKNWVNALLCYNGGTRFSPENMTTINGTVVGKIDFDYWSSSKIDFNYLPNSLKLLTTSDSASIFVGTGGREESLEDIALESIIPDSDLTIMSANAHFSKGKYIFDKTFTYIGANDITINEVAFYKTLRASSAFYPCCFARQKVPPLTVKTGDIFTVTMVIG